MRLCGQILTFHPGPRRAPTTTFLVAKKYVSSTSAKLVEVRWAVRLAFHCIVGISFTAIVAIIAAAWK
jgi:hypothetical protein